VQTDSIRICSHTGSRNKMAMEAGGPFDDLAASYVDKLLGKLEPGRGLVRLAIATLDKPSQRILASALMPASESNARHSFGEAMDTDEWFPRAVSEAMEKWKPGVDTKAADDDTLVLDPAFVEKELIEAFEACHATRSFIDPLAEQRRRLKTVFGLETLEIDILAVLYTCTIHQPIDAFFDSISLREFHHALALCTGSDARQTKRLLSPAGNLVRMGFVEPDFFPPPHFRLEGEMRSFFAKPDTLFASIEPLDAKRAGHVYRLESFPVSGFSREIVASILKSGHGNMLIHGVPGTGKTSFVISMLHELGIPAFFLSALLDSNENKPAFLRIGFAAHVAKNSGAVLVIDESDTLINTEGRNSEGDRLAKAWLTEFMDHHDGSIVWIANDLDTVHDAVKRRYLYSLEFGAQTERQRISLWNELVRNYGLDATIQGDQIASLAKRHEVNAGGIDIALRGLKGYLASGHEKATGSGEQLAILSEFLSRHETLMTGRRLNNQSRFRRDTTLYIPDAINVDTPLSEIVPTLKTVASVIRARTERTVMNQEHVHWVDPMADEQPVEAKLLFSGGPGTGKTAFARWLSDALELPLVQRRASDLLGALVGETEHNIAAAFEEAETRGAILLLDEADSLFINRRDAVQSWERSQTNELLTRMEDFSGILVCCTNRREDFDPAAMRRFQWKVTFSPPKAEQRLELYKRYFTQFCGLPGENTVDALRRIEGLCPGDFAAVYKALVPLRASSPSFEISHETILVRLRTELGFRDEPSGRIIGFAS